MVADATDAADAGREERYDALDSVRARSDIPRARELERDDVNLEFRDEEDFGIHGSLFFQFVRALRVGIDG